MLDVLPPAPHSAPAPNPLSTIPHFARSSAHMGRVNRALSTSGLFAQLGASTGDWREGRGWDQSISLSSLPASLLWANCVPQQISAPLKEAHSPWLPVLPDSGDFCLSLSHQPRVATAPLLFTLGSWTIPCSFFRPCHIFIISPFLNTVDPGAMQGWGAPTLHAVKNACITSQSALRIRNSISAILHLRIQPNSDPVVL